MAHTTRILHAQLGLLIAVAATLPAQSFTVGGANPSYPDIATAVAAVPSGSVLDVRPGVYDPFWIEQKSITILGGPGVELDSLITVVRIENLRLDQHVSLHGLHFRSQLVNARMFAENNQGQVVLDGLTADLRGLELIVLNSRDVRIRRCDFHSLAALGPVRATNSNLRIVHSSLDSAGVLGALWLEASIADLTNSDLLAGFWASPATLTNSHLTLRGTCSLQASNLPAIAGSGSVRIDPQVTLISGTAQPIDTGIVVTTRELPAVVATVGPPGQSTTATLRGPSAGYGWLFAGVPAPRIPLALPTGADSDALDLLATSQVLLGSGALTTPLVASYVSPTLPSLLGARITWQGLSMDSTNDLQISNSVTYAHR